MQGIIRYDLDGLSFYEGDWVSDMRQGYGVRRYHSGNVYEGEWMANNRHGQGIMRWVDLDQSYNGQWVNGVQVRFRGQISLKTSKWLLPWAEVEMMILRKSED